VTLDAFLELLFVDCEDDDVFVNFFV